MSQDGSPEDLPVFSFLLVLSNIYTGPSAKVVMKEQNKLLANSPIQPLNRAQ